MFIINISITLEARTELTAHGFSIEEDNNQLFIC